MKRRVLGSLIAVALVYYFFLFPQELLNRIELMVATRQAQWLTLTVGAAGNVTLVLILSFVLFASDSAFRGANKTAKWARSLFASHAAVERFRCTDGQASTLWFRYFDTWGLDGSPNRNLLINSYAGTYAARAIFYLSRALVLFLVLAAMTILLHWQVFDTYAVDDWITRLIIHVLATLVFLASLVFIVSTNRLPKGDRAATGCWAKIEDVFARSRTVFEHEILRHAATLDEALELVATMRQDLLNDS